MAANREQSPHMTSLGEIELPVICYHSFGVVVIEEINRGNPAQIFGEMLTLLEADKRTPTEALELSYRRNESERMFVPDNLYVIGTMRVT
jgi:5-methylcytosine-specific restriction endonuclease McrBC GTP-binding regulatory subunit McrB